MEIRYPFLPLLTAIVMLSLVMANSIALSGDNVPWHPLQHVSTDSGGATSVDADSNGKIDVSDKSEDLECTGCVDGTEVEGTVVGDCTVWKFDNRGGNNWRYWRFDLPYDCYPTYEESGYLEQAEGVNWGCELEMQGEHHSSNSQGVWLGQKELYFHIWPNARNTGNHYINIFAPDSYWGPYDMTGAQSNYFSTSYHDVCRWYYESYYDGSWHTATKKSGVGWSNMGFAANAYTVCYLKICEKRQTDGITASGTCSYNC
jgi:hypothetical protein